MARLREYQSLNKKLVSTQNRIDEIIGLSYGLGNRSLNLNSSSPIDNSVFENSVDIIQITRSIVSYLLGCIYGRWDIRCTNREVDLYNSPDPFDPLPTFPPGMLISDQKFPYTDDTIIANYPLEITWTGILVDDKNHKNHIVNRLRDALGIIRLNRADIIEQEICQILSIQTFNEYFSQPSKFFADHLKMLFQNHRQAPIYWHSPHHRVPMHSGLLSSAMIKCLQLC
jgi:hypothetical protein